MGYSKTYYTKYYERGCCFYKISFFFFFSRPRKRTGLERIKGSWDKRVHEVSQVRSNKKPLGHGIRAVLTVLNHISLVQTYYNDSRGQF